MSIPAMFFPEKKATFPSGDFFMLRLETMEASRINSKWENHLKNQLKRHLISEFSDVMVENGNTPSRNLTLIYLVDTKI